MNAKPSSKSRPADGNRETVLSVHGMDCEEEVRTVKKTMRRLASVHSVEVNLMAGRATVIHDEGTKPRVLIEALAAAGLRAEQPGKTSIHGFASEHRSRLLSVAVSGVFLAAGLACSWTGTGPSGLDLAFYVIAILAGGWFILPKAVRAVRHFSPDMNLLMTVAVLGAAGIGEWAEGGAVTFLFALSELLESFSVARARRAIKSLVELSPETAWVKREDSIEECPVEDVRPGDIVAVKSGARVPLDGEVVAGESSVNQSPITGESMPVAKQPGAKLFAGSINGEGSLEFRVTKPFQDTTLSRIIHMVEEAQSQKAPTQRFVDVFARYYTPTVMALALLVWLLPPLLFAGAWVDWTYRALVLLVIACPCALVIATPVSIVSGLTAMARRGVLIKGGAHLESIGKLRALALDKTGTITEGKPRVTQIVCLADQSESDVLRVAAAIDVHSNHPLAQAVVNCARERQIDFPRAQQYRSQTGRGAEGELDGHRYFAGNHRFAHELKVCSDKVESQLAAMEEQAQSVVVVGHKPHGNCAGQVLGILAVGDRLRPHAKKAIQSLRAVGVSRIVMLSGDNQRTVDAIAREAGIDEATGDLLPDDKIKRVRELVDEMQHVGMVGDGVNDAPAMAAATVSIAMGAAGTDTAIETADMALMRDDLTEVARAVHSGRRTLRIIQTNIAFALAVKALFLVLAMLGYTSLWLAILADTGATLLVVANALRLLRDRPALPNCTETSL